MFFLERDEESERVEPFLFGDEGAGFDPEDVPDPTQEENLERPCGRGLLLMRYYMNEVQFFDRGTTVVMWKRRNGSH